MYCPATAGLVTFDYPISRCHYPALSAQDR